MRTLTTKEAETIYHIPADTFTQWCREGKLPAVKVSGEWQMAITDIDAFLTANPALRPATAQRENRAWIIFGATATVLGFVVDAVALRDIILGGDRTLLWIMAGLLSVALWVTALVVLRPRLQKGRPFRLTEQPRFTSKPLLIATRVVAVGMPLMLVLGVVGYNVWRAVPPNQTIVLVADFRDPTGVDSARVTQSLVDGMRETLNEHQGIKIKRLNQFIPAEGVCKQARAIGNQPEHKAAFVIWGDYTLQPDPELHVRFDILRSTETCLPTGLAEIYGPVQILQPSMFAFKSRLSAHLGYLTAFASGLTLFQSGQYTSAIPLFETAANADDDPLNSGVERASRFYRGASHLQLGLPSKARPDLEAVAGEVGSTAAQDWMSLAALGNLGNVAFLQGDFEAAHGHYEKALAAHSRAGDLSSQAKDLGNLGNIYMLQGRYATAVEYYEQAIRLNGQLGNREEQAADLSNLGAVLLEQGNLSAAKSHCEQALRLYQETRSLLGQARSLIGLGNVALEEGDNTQARRLYGQALKLFVRAGNRLGEAQARQGLGNVAVKLGDPNAARDYYQHVLDITTQEGDVLGQAQSLSGLGDVALNEGDHVAAKEYHERALALANKLSSLSLRAEHLMSVGNVSAAQGDYSAATMYFEQALGLYTQLGHLPGQAECQAELGGMMAIVGDYVTASSHLERALELNDQLKRPSRQAYILGTLGWIAGAQGDYSAATQYLEQALSTASEADWIAGQALLLYQLDDIAAELGDYAAAKAYLEQSATLYRQMGMPVDPAVESALQQLAGQE